MAVGKPLTIHNAGQSAHVVPQRGDHQPLVQFSSMASQDSHSQRTHVFRCGLFRRVRVQYRGNL